MGFASVERLGANLYRFADSCLVYVVRSGGEAVLVDFGSGAVLEALADIGVERVAAVLMTHHHRDQGQGLARAVAQGIPIWVPHTEQDLFHSVDAHWQARELLNSYNNRQDRFSLLEPVPVADTLQDYRCYTFAAQTFEVVPTPGHTTGSVTLLTELDDQRLAFSGDLIAAPGKLWSLSATQWSYNGAEGVAASVASLLDLQERRPDRLLPAHGEAMDDPEAAIAPLVETLLQLLKERRQNPRLLALRERPYEALTPHLLRNRTGVAYHYVLLSKSGKALFIDFGYDFVTGVAAGADRASRRPWLYTLGALKRDFGVTEVDVAVPTHYHDDHVAGLNLLRDIEGTEVWAAETFADILERPQRYDLPCLWYDSVPVDRRLPLETPIAWQEYEITLYEQPGHTRYAVAVGFEVDGVRALAIGDQYQNGGEAQWNYVYNNGFASDDYRRSAALYRRLQPELILSGHWEPYWVEVGYFERLDERGETVARLHCDLLATDSSDGAFGTLSIQPYQPTVGRGDSLVLEAHLQNPLGRAVTATLILVAPQGWQVEPCQRQVELAAFGSGAASFQVTPTPEPVRRARVAAELFIDAQPLGQLAEVLVTVT